MVSQGQSAAIESTPRVLPATLAQVSSVPAARGTLPTADSSIASNESLHQRLPATQVDSLRAGRQLFSGNAPAPSIATHERMYCDACERAKPATGSIHYGHYGLCNTCAGEYEAALAGGLLTSAGQYVRDKRFGDGDLYALS